MDLAEDTYIERWNIPIDVIIKRKNSYVITYKQEKQWEKYQTERKKKITIDISHRHSKLFFIFRTRSLLICVTLTMSVTFRPQNTKAAATKRIIRYVQRKRIKLFLI